MKRIKKVRFYTDYPMLHLGDKPSKVAPMREITLLSYDGDKYCTVRIGRKKMEIKSGYIYQSLSSYTLWRLANKQ